MPRDFFRKFIPPPEKVNSHRKYKLLRPLLNRPYLWHLNRHSVAKGFACGAFWSMWPVAGQTIPALLIAVRMRCNVAIAFAGLWLSNPLVLVPHWWSAYLIGRFLLRTPPSNVEFTWAYLWPRMNNLPGFIKFAWENFYSLYIPVFVGSLIEGVFLAAVGYFLINTVWKAHTRKRWRKSRARAAVAAKPKSPAAGELALT